MSFEGQKDSWKKHTSILRTKLSEERYCFILAASTSKSYDKLDLEVRNGGKSWHAIDKSGKQEPTLTNDHRVKEVKIRCWICFLLWKIITNNNDVNPVSNFYLAFRSHVLTWCHTTMKSRKNICWYTHLTWFIREVLLYLYAKVAPKLTDVGFTLSPLQ